METFYYIKSAKQVANLQRILEETAKATHVWTEYHMKKTMRRGVWLVKDSGAYIMSAACLEEGEEPRKKVTVAYIDGFGSKCDWDKQQAAWGGDDFCLLLELPTGALTKIKNGAKVSAARLRVEQLDDGRLSAVTLGVSLKP